MFPNAQRRPKAKRRARARPFVSKNCAFLKLPGKDFFQTLLLLAARFLLGVLLVIGALSCIRFSRVRRLRVAVRRCVGLRRLFASRSRRARRRCVPRRFNHRRRRARCAGIACRGRSRCWSCLGRWHAFRRCRRRRRASRCNRFYDRRIRSRTASSTVPLDPTTGLVKQVPGYVVLNAMARYTLTDNLSLQANVFNLANRNYIDEIHPAHIVPGAGTSGLFGLNFRF